MKSKDEIIQILSKFKTENDNLGIITLGLFGSCARGEQNESSDIDICVKFDHADFMRFFITKSKLSDILGCKVDLVSLHKYLDISFVNSINKDVVYV